MKVAGIFLLVTTTVSSSSSKSVRRLDEENYNDLIDENPNLTLLEHELDNNLLASDNDDNNSEKEDNDDVYRARIDKLSANDNNNSEKKDNDIIQLDMRVPSVDMFPNRKAKGLGYQFSCMTHALRDNENGHIVGWEPLLDHPEHVHHMDVFLCNSDLLESIEYPYEEDSHKCGSIPFMDCNGFGAVYDKGAMDGYQFPQNVGIQYGLSNTPSSVFVLQVHYLYPHEPPAVNSEKKDSSGMRLFLNENSSDIQNARMIAFMDSSLSLPPGKANYDHTYTVTSEHLRRTIGQEEYNAKLKVFATHMHAHDSCTSMTVRHQTTNHNLKDEMIVKSMAQYHGYGDDQNWKSVNDTILNNNFDEKETLTISCTFDTSANVHKKFHRTTRYGVGLHDEMCGIILLYYETNDMANSLGEFALIEPMSD